MALKFALGGEYADYGRRKPPRFAIAALFRVLPKDLPTSGVSTKEITMAFTINIQNDGPDGNVSVNEIIDENEIVQVFDDFIDGGGLISDVPCQGTPPKSFRWTHHATELSGQEDNVRDGDTVRVYT